MTSVQHQAALDTRAPPPFVQAGNFAASDLRNVLLPRDAFWLLAGSLVTDDSEMGVAAANTFLQRLLWETNIDLGFFLDSHGNDFSPRDKKECVTCRVKRITTKKLESVSFRLANWQCDRNNTFSQCVQELMVSFYAHLRNFRIIETLDSFFKMLNSLNYDYPTRFAYDFAKKLSSMNGTKVRYAASKTSILGRSQQAAAAKQAQETDVFHPFCKISNVSYSGVNPTKHKIENILLIIVFNWADYVKDIPFIQRAYGRHFRYIAYCSEVINDFSRFYNETANPITYIEINHFRGHRGYDCMAIAMRMGYDVDGYLQMSDDVILNVWNLPKMPVDKVWFQRLRIGDVRAPFVPDIDKRDSWIPWNFDVGQPIAGFVLRGLESLVSHPVVGTKVSSFLSRLHSRTNSTTCVLYEASDIFYVPASLKFDYIFFFNVFTRYKFYLEIAVPTFFGGAIPPTELHTLVGKYVWYSDRDKYEHFYNHSDVFHHSWKLSRMYSAEGAKFFCSRFLSKLELDLT